MRSLIAGLVCFVALCPAASGDAKVAPALELILELDGGYSLHASMFVVAIRSSGLVERHQDAPPGPDQVPASIRVAIAGLLEREGFFKLRQSYGACATDLGHRRITATLRGRRHQVRFCDMKAAGIPLRDIHSFLHVWYGVLLEISEPGAVEVWDYDANILDRKSDDVEQSVAPVGARS